MSSVVTRQDLQGVLDVAKNRIIERMLTKRDVQIACETARDRIIAGLHEMYQFQQQSSKQSLLQLTQQTRRVAGMEMRMYALETEVKALRQLIFQMSEQQKSIASAIATMPTYIAAATQTGATQEAATAPLSPQYGTT